MDTKHSHRLLIALIITGIFFFVELIGGIMTNSLALLSDAGHMFTDVGAIALSLAAMKFALKPPTERNTYGFYRLEILAAFINGLTLVIIAGFIFYEAYDRFFDPPKVIGSGMLIIAVFGLAVNIASGMILHKSHKHSINVKGAYLHVMGDALGSLGVIIAALLILLFEWKLADPIISVIIAVIIIVSSLHLLKETVHILMQGTPGHLSIKEIKEAILKINGVDSVHDLHIWSLTNGMENLSVHVSVAKGCDQESCNGIVQGIQSTLEENFNIKHSTIQIEHDGFTEKNQLIHS